MVRTTDEPSCRSSACLAHDGPPTPVALCTSETTSSSGPVDSLSTVRRSLQTRGFSTQAVDIILQSWRGSTKKQYDCYIKKWVSYCSECRIDTLQPSLTEAADFLVKLHSVDNLGYSALNTARSALSCFLPYYEGQSFGKHETIKRLMTGFFNIKPPKPRYSHTWDVSIVLKFLVTLRPLHSLSLKMLTHKLAMLLVLVTGQRCQTIVNLDLNYFSEGSEIVFTFAAPLKHDRPGTSPQRIVLSSYPPNVDLCVVTVLHEYIKQTAPLRGEESRLLISYVRPHKKITTDSLSRWLKFVMHASGVDTSVFHAHSCRAASTSKASRTEVPIDTILTAAGWSRVTTFRQYYDKPLCASFADNVLQI